MMVKVIVRIVSRLMAGLPQLGNDCRPCLDVKLRASVGNDCGPWLDVNLRARACGKNHVQCGKKYSEQ